MTTWLLSILGIGILDVIVMHFTEHTRMHKAVKMCCSVIFVLAIITPIPGLINGTLNMDAFSFEFSTEIDSSMSDIVNKQQVVVLEKATEYALTADGYNVDVKISAEFDDGEMKITQVRVDYPSQDLLLISKISEYLGIGKEYICIDVKE